MSISTSTSINGDIMVQKGYVGLLGNTIFLVYYPIVSYKNIYVYRVETLDMVNIPLTHWCQWKMLFSYPRKYYGIYCTVLVTVLVSTKFFRY